MPFKPNAAREERERQWTESEINDLLEAMEALGCDVDKGFEANKLNLLQMERFVKYRI